MGNVYIGTSGYSYKHWKGLFYPEDLAQGEWLGFYAKQYSTVEINATFYRLLSAATFKKWRKVTPSDFTFCLKGPRLVTHYKQLKNAEQTISEFFTAASGLSEKLALILWQFSPRFRATEKNIDKLKTFLHTLPQLPKSIIELRDESWFGNEMMGLFKEIGISLAISDSQAFPGTREVTSSPVYIRLHGPDAFASSSYSEKELKEWASRISEFRKRGDVYCYFNNDIGGHAINNARRLKEILQV